MLDLILKFTQNGNIMSFKMYFQPTQRQVDVKSECSVLETALKARIKINHSCGGMGTCGTCRVLVTKGGEQLPARNEIELEMALDRGFKENERLACQTVPVADLELEIL
jgi:2Fe-2S ferredoxin